MADKEKSMGLKPNQMEILQKFNNELSSMYEARLPISKAKMSQITRISMSGVKMYKHIVQSVERFIHKCRPEYKLPALYVIDSIVRQSKHQFGSAEVYSARFSKNFLNTFQNLLANCVPDDKPKIVRVLNLWQRNVVFSPEVIQPLLDLANPNSLSQGRSEISPLPMPDQNSHKSIGTVVPGFNPAAMINSAAAAANAVTSLANNLSKVNQKKDNTTLVSQLQQLASSLNMLKNEEAQLKQVKTMENQEIANFADVDYRKANSDLSNVPIDEDELDSTPTEAEPPFVKPTSSNNQASSGSMASIANLVHNIFTNSDFLNQIHNIDGSTSADVLHNVTQLGESMQPLLNHHHASSALGQLGQNLSSQSSHFSNNNDSQSSSSQFSQYQNSSGNTYTGQFSSISNNNGQVSLEQISMQYQQSQNTIPSHNEFESTAEQSKNSDSDYFSNSNNNSSSARSKGSSQSQPSSSSDRRSDRSTSRSHRVDHDYRDRDRDRDGRRDRSDRDVRDRSPREDRRKKDDRDRDRRSDRRGERSNRSRWSRSRTRSRSPRSRASRSPREQSEREKERDRRKKGLPQARPNYLTISSTTIWLGHLPKFASDSDLSDAFGDFGIDAPVIDMIPSRGCAYVCMLCRADAFKAMNKLKSSPKILGTTVKFAWAPGKGVKGVQYKDFWESDIGCSFIPHSKLNENVNFVELAEGGVISDETMPPQLIELRDRQKRAKKEEEDAALRVNLEPQISIVPVAEPVENQLPKHQSNRFLRAPLLESVPLLGLNQQMTMPSARHAEVLPPFPFNGSPQPLMMISRPGSSLPPTLPPQLPLPILSKWNSAINNDNNDLLATNGHVNQTPGGMLASAPLLPTPKPNKQLSSVISPSESYYQNDQQNESHKSLSPPTFFDNLPNSGEPSQPNHFDGVGRLDDQPFRNNYNRNNWNPNNKNGNNFMIHKNGSNSNQDHNKANFPFKLGLAKDNPDLPPMLSHPPGLIQDEPLMFNRSDEAFAPSLYELQNRHFDGPPGPAGQPRMPFGMPLQSGPPFDMPFNRPLFNGPGGGRPPFMPNGHPMHRPMFHGGPLPPRHWQPGVGGGRRFNGGNESNMNNNFRGNNRNGNQNGGRSSRWEQQGKFNSPIHNPQLESNENEDSDNIAMMMEMYEDENNSKQNSDAELSHCDTDKPNTTASVEDDHSMSDRGNANDSIDGDTSAPPDNEPTVEALSA